MLLWKILLGIFLIGRLSQGQDEDFLDENIEQAAVGEGTEGGEKMSVNLIIDSHVPCGWEEFLAHLGTVVNLEETAEMDVMDRRVKKEIK
ncbi:hypothetical protein M9458_002956, partial [Cirrhinus mrigala]